MRATLYFHGVESICGSVLVKDNWASIGKGAYMFLGGVPPPPPPLPHRLCCSIIKRPARDACLCMGELQAPPAPPAPPAPHFVFLITL